MPEQQGPVCVTPEMTIADVVQQKPEAAAILAEYGMGCIMCMGAMAETLAEGAMMHGVDIDELLEKLNGTEAEKEAPKR